MPRFYLRGFEDNGHIIAHSKEKRRSFRTKVGQVAHSNGFYSEEVEKFLTENIEEPANPALLNLRQGKRLDANQRLALARYIFVLWKRVPKAKQRGMAKLPQEIHEVGLELDAVCAFWEAARPDLRQEIQERRQALHAALQTQVTDPQQSVWNGSIREEGRDAIESLLSMNWVYFTCDKVQFLTSDNPVFTFSGLGLNKPTSELSLPLSHSIVFWATRSQVKDNVFIPTTKSTAKELNRRTAHGADRFLFSRADEPWIIPFISQSGWALNSIQL